MDYSNYLKRLSNIPNYEFYFARSEDALRVLNGLKDIIALYDVATIADLKDLAGIPGNYTDNKYGWFNSKSMAVRSLDILNPSRGYMLYLPKPFPIDPDGEPHVVSKLKSETPEFKAALPKAAKDEKIQKAYNALTKAYCKKDVDRSELTWAVEEAIGYLGEVLE